MQTVNFQCGHCGNLMAVTPDMLGRQVRCPHCQEVVVAAAPAAQPATPPPQPSGPALPLVAAAEPESIFTPDEQASEDVFGAVPRPVAEILPTPPPPVTVPMPAVPDPPPALVNPFADVGAEPAAPADREQPEQLADDSLTADATLWGDGAPAPADDGEHLAAFNEQAGPRVVAARGSSGWLTVALIVPLISYSILATILIFILYQQKESLKQSLPHPLEMLPDLEGDNVGARRVTVYYRTQPDIALPANLRVGLGESLRVGDLELTPLRVEQAVIGLTSPGGGANTQRHKSLVLHLRMKNVSENVAFKPTDPEFQRAWDATRVSGMPYTFLEMGDRRFYGGPIRWTPDNPTGRRADVTLDGANLDRELRPGESMQTFVCTHPELKAADHVAKHAGKMLWRVQVRRGLVRVKDREVSATAVVGVEFTRDDIQVPWG